MTDDDVRNFGERDTEQQAHCLQFQTCCCSPSIVQLQSNVATLIAITSSITTFKKASPHNTTYKGKINKVQSPTKGKQEATWYQWKPNLKYIKKSSSSSSSSSPCLQAKIRRFTKANKGEREESEGCPHVCLFFGATNSEPTVSGQQISEWWTSNIQSSVEQYLSRVWSDPP